MEKMTKYQVLEPLKRAKNYAFNFVKNNKSFIKKSTKKTNLLEDFGPINGASVITSVLAITAIVALVIVEGMLGKNAFGALLDPLGTQAVSNVILIAFGSAIALLSILSGTFLHGAFYPKTNTITGKKTRDTGSKFGLGLFLASGVITFQYWLVQFAGGGESEFDSYAMLAIALVILEILVGIMFWNKAWLLMSIFSISVLIWIISKRMNKNAQKTDEFFGDYELMREAWNTNNASQTLELEYNNNIRHAKLFYDGIDVNIENKTTIKKNHKVHVEDKNIPLKETSEEEIEDFLDDNDEDNLTF